MKSIRAVADWLKGRRAGLVDSAMPVTVNRFPGPGDFVGSYDARTADMHDGGQSTYNGSIAVTLIDRSLVEKVLPGDFSLAQRADSGSTHPVIHLFGHQRDLMIVQGGIPEPAGADDYQEMILLIPFVVRASGTKWHSFVVRMYLDDAAAVGLGNAVYAYAKLLAALTESGPPENLTMQVLLLSEPFFRGTVKLAGPWRTSGNAGATLPRWSDLQEIFRMPLVGADVVLGTVVRVVCSYWEWDYTAVEVAPASSQHQFLRPFREGTQDWPLLGLLSSASGGAFAIRGLRWRLAEQPPPCRF
jgi:hypothetical protein